MAVTKRYDVKRSNYGCVLQLAEGYGSEGQASEHEFWVSPGSGYVFETTLRPGTTGRQVCESLFGLGATLISSELSLVADIRRLAKKHCARIDRESDLYR